MNCECSHKKTRKVPQDFPIKRKLESRVVFLGPLPTSIKQISKFLFEGMFYLWTFFCLYVDTFVCGCTCASRDLIQMSGTSSINLLPYSLRQVLSIKARTHRCGKSYKHACSMILFFFFQYWSQRSALIPIQHLRGHQRANSGSHVCATST